MMKRVVAVPALLIGLFAGQMAFAQPAKLPGSTGEASSEMKQLPSTRNRAQVKAECVEALKAGKGPTGECSPEADAKSTRTRAEVKAECTAAIKAGKTPTGECSN